VQRAIKADGQRRSIGRRGSTGDGPAARRVGLCSRCTLDYGVGERTGFDRALENTGVARGRLKGEWLDEDQLVAIIALDLRRALGGSNGQRIGLPCAWVAYLVYPIGARIGRIQHRGCSGRCRCGGRGRCRASARRAAASKQSDKCQGRQ